MTETNEPKPDRQSRYSREQRFHVLIESFPHFFWEARADGTGIFSNKRMLEYLGKPLKEVRGKGWLETVHPDDRRRVSEAWAHAVLTGEEYSVETRIRNGRTGEYRWFLTRAVPHRGPQGRISRWFGTCTDIHKSKQAEQSLRESEDRFRTVLENLPGGVFLHDLEGNILLVNAAAIQNTGYTQEELLAMTVADIDPESVTREDRSRLWHRLSTAGLITIESTHFRKNGSQYPTEVHLNAIELDGRAVILAIAYDITRRKQTEAALRESEARMRLLIEHAPSALALFDREMRYLSASRRWLTDYHLEARDLIGRSHYEIFPEIPEHWKAVHRRALAGEVLRNESDRFERDDGSVQWLRWEVRPWRDHRGEVAGVVMFTEDISERRQAEEALRESRTRFERSQQVAHLGSWEFDLARGELTWSDEVFRIFGLQPQAFRPTYEAFLRCVHPDDRAAVDAAYADSLREQRDGYEIEHRVVSAATGEIRIVHEKCEHLRDDAGRIVRSVGMVHDITERKQAEKALRESEQKFRALFENSPDAVLLTFPDGSIEAANPAACEIFGWSNEDICRIGRSGILDAQDPRLAAALQERQRTGRVKAKELTAIRKNEERFTVEVDSVILPTDPVRSFVIMRDITERKKAEEALRNAYGRLQTLYDHRIDGIGVVIADAAGNVIQANDYFLKILGRSREELTSGKIDWRSMTPPEWRATDEYALRQLKERGVYFTAEKEYFHRNGSRVPVLISGITISGGSDEILTFVLDITERKRFEQSLHQLNQTLEQRVAERTALAESRSRQLQALAVELIEAEELERQRIAGLLHDDLQQLLAAARFTLESSSHSDPELEEVQRLLEASIRKARHLSHELSPVVLHQSGLIAALEWLAVRMKEQFELEVQLDKATARQVESAPLKVFMFRAVQELLFNVVKHAGVNRARVALTGSDDEFVITVSDPGSGFDTSTLETRTPKAGLGLLTLRERASYIGGSLTIVSAPGKGSRLILRAPADIDRTILPVHPAADEVEKPPPAKTDAAADGPGIRVLFADDHMVMRQGLIRLISGKPNISVAGEAANGRQAVELARQLQPDVIVMDVSMPGMDGIEATQRIKAELPGVRVIGLSMFEDEHTSRAMRDAGAEAFVSKAASSSELLKAIYGIEHQDRG